MRVLGTHWYQCTIGHCCERLHSDSVNFFLRLFQHICPFRDGWFMSAPAHTTLSVQQFLTKNSTTPKPHTSYSPDLTLSNFFFVSPDEKSLQRETFCWCGRGEIKMAEALKGIKINEFKNCFEQWKSLDRYIASNRVLWRWLKFKHVRINIHNF